MPRINAGTFSYRSIVCTETQQLSYFLLLTIITGELRSKVDRMWEAFWAGDIANPLTATEQIIHLSFVRRLDELHAARESQAH